MAKTPKKEQAAESEERKDAKSKDENKTEKPKRDKKTTSSDEVEEKPKIKKKQAKAKAIDKTQSRRLVRPKRTQKKKTRKVVRAVQAVKEPRNIGVEVTLPTESCDDPYCPFHGTLSVRGQILNGVVVSSKMNKTAIVQREIKRFIPKYERFEKRTHNYPVHNPPCLNVQRGDMVKIMECRPLSKSKSFVVIEKL